MRRVLVMLAAAALALTACGPGGMSSVPVPQEPSPTTPTPGPWGDASTITVAQLQACPLGDSLENGAIPAGVNACTKGTLNGIVTAGSTEKCSLTLGGDGTLTFVSPALSQAIILSPGTAVFYQHTRDNGLSTLSYTLEDNRYAPSGRVSIGFAFYEMTSETMPNIYISIRADTQTATCYTRIK